VAIGFGLNLVNHCCGDNPTQANRLIITANRQGAECAAQRHHTAIVDSLRDTMIGENDHPHERVLTRFHPSYIIISARSD
jgi:hypothetical protein